MCSSRYKLTIFLRDLSLSLLYPRDISRGYLLINYLMHDFSFNFHLVVKKLVKVNQGLLGKLSWKGGGMRLVVGNFFSKGEDCETSALVILGYQLEWDL